MKTLLLSSSMPTFKEELIHTQARINAEFTPDHEFSRLVAEYLESWPVMFQKEMAARDAVTMNQALVEAGNDNIDDETLTFGNRLFSSAGRDRDSLFFKRFMPVAPYVLNGWNLRRQASFILDVIIAELLKLADNHELRSCIEPLQTKATAALAALDARDSARAQLALVNNEVDEWKESVNRMRASLHAELLKYAAANGKPREWAERFFRQTRRAAAGDEPQDNSRPA